jgi:hypothetical protein
MRKLLATLAVGAAMFPAALHALPPGPQVVCDTYPQSAYCEGGEMPQCTLCHTQPPDHNAFGLALADVIEPGDFETNLPAALAAVEDGDADEDGLTNLEELLAGTSPGIANPNACGELAYDADYVFKKVSLDFCGVQPSFDEYDAFTDLPEDEKLPALHMRLDTCLHSEYWRGKDGALWEIAHPKIRPVGALQQFGDYEIDYNLWVWSQIDGHDARDAITADYFVTREDGDDTTYAQVDQLAGQNTPTDRRAGILTSKWFLIYFTMFTAVPRNASSQAYRAFLGMDIARLQGLDPVSNEPFDYDEKGVQAEDCAICHSTLDPLTYPFAFYCGFPEATYCEDRPSTFADQWPEMVNMPESGVVLGEEVADLREWVQVAANSDEYAEARVMDYWKRFFSAPPSDEQRADFDALVDGLQDEHEFSIEAMLHDLIETEAYGAK